LLGPLLCKVLSDIPGFQFGLYLGSFVIAPDMSVAVGDPLTEFADWFVHYLFCSNISNECLKVRVLIGIMYDLIDNGLKLGPVFL